MSTQACQKPPLSTPAYTPGMAPAVGLSPCLDERERWRPGREYLYLDRAYAQAVEAAGGTPMLLPLGGDPAALIERVDALVIPGGDDFPPDRPYPDAIRFEIVSPRQLEFDRALLAAARARGLPVLGICYGAQLMALARGGSLHHHLPRDLPQAHDHALDEVDGRHGIRIESGTRLAEILETDATRVNSLHHQAVAEVGPEMRVSARAEDGVIEAIEGRGEHFEIGVQWHPEKLPDRGGEALFRALIGAAGGK